MYDIASTHLVAELRPKLTSVKHFIALTDRAHMGDQSSIGEV